MLDINIQLLRDDFRLNIDARLTGPVTGLFGPSGAGKSTLLNCIAGLARPNKGRIALDGRVLFDSERKIDRPPHRRRVGMVFQDDRLFPHLTVGGNLNYARRWLPVGRRRFKLSDILDMLDIGPLLERRIGTLSGGQRQRIAIGRAILGCPDILLLDEPMSALDGPLKEQILPFLQRIRHQLGIPMLFISHNMHEVLTMSDQLLLLNQGRVLAHGTFLELVRQPKNLPLLREQGLTNVIELQVKAHRLDQGMTLMSRPVEQADTGVRERSVVVKGPLHTQFAINESIHALIRPQDIALALGPVEYISMQNQLVGHIERTFILADRAYCWVDCGIPLIVEITAQAQRDFELVAGKRVWCLFKAQALQLFENGKPSAAMVGARYLSARPASVIADHRRPSVKIEGAR